MADAHPAPAPAEREGSAVDGSSASDENLSRGVLGDEQTVWLKGKLGKYAWLVAWPWLPVVSLLGICLYILNAQFMKSLEITYSWSYEVKVKVSIVDEDDKYTGGDTSNMYFNVWEGIRELLDEGAYVLGYVVMAWSGIWPYLKLLILCVGLIVYRNQRLPRAFEWLSHIAHFSFLDAWMVAIAGIAIRFYYKDSEEKNEDDIVDIVVKLTVKLWTQAYALDGIYIFFSAIVLSQAAGFIFIKMAQFDSAFDLKPLDTKASKSEIMKRECFNLKCLGWRFGTDILAALEMRITSKVSWATSKLGDAVAIIFAALVLALILAWSAFLSTSFHEKIFEVYWYFYMSEKIDKTYDDITFDKTYTFSKELTPKYSVVSGLNELVLTNEVGVGRTNYGLFSLGYLLIVALPLLRIALVAIMWIGPLPKVLHRTLSLGIEAVSLFVNHDVFLIAFWVMVYLGQLHTLFDEATSTEASEFDDDDLDETLDFNTFAIEPGLKRFVTAVVGEVLIWNFVTYLHMYHYMPTWDVEDAGLAGAAEGGDEKAKEEGKEEQKETEGTPLLT